MFAGSKVACSLVFPWHAQPKFMAPAAAPEHCLAAHAGEELHMERALAAAVIFNHGIAVIIYSASLQHWGAVKE